MRVIDLWKNGARPTMSFEFFPARTPGQRKACRPPSTCWRACGLISCRLLSGQAVRRAKAPANSSASCMINRGWMSLPISPDMACRRRILLPCWTAIGRWVLRMSSSYTESPGREGEGFRPRPDSFPYAAISSPSSARAITAAWASPVLYRKAISMRQARRRMWSSSS